jgi:hypothetical protein
MSVVISLNEVSRAHVIRGGCRRFSASGWRLCARCAEAFAVAAGRREPAGADDSAAAAGPAAAD